MRDAAESELNRVDGLVDHHITEIELKFHLVGFNSMTVENCWVNVSHCPEGSYRLPLDRSFRRLWTSRIH